MNFDLTGRSDLSMQESMGTGELSQALGGVQVELNRRAQQNYVNPHDERPVGGGSGSYPSTDDSSNMMKTAY